MKHLYYILFLLIPFFGINAQSLRQQTICLSSEPVSYSIKGSDGMKFTWHVPKMGIVLKNDTLNDTIKVVWQKADNYTLTVDGEINGCIVSKSIKVNVVNGPVVSLGNDEESICEGSEKVITLPDNVYDSIRWSHGIKGPVYSTNKTDTVKVKVYLKGCSDEDEMIITQVPKPEIDLGDDTMAFGENLELTLDAKITGVNYAWTLTNLETNEVSNAYSKTVNVLKGKWMVVLAVSEDVCSTSDTIYLKRGSIPWDEKNIPNFITPNNDGHNDTWRIPGITEFTNCTIEIYDRWGRIVFRADHGYSNNWDGKMGNTDLPIDSYYYIINLNDKKSKPIYGTVTIIK